MEIGIENSYGEEFESRGENQFDSRIEASSEYRSDADENFRINLEGQNAR